MTKTKLKNLKIRILENRISKKDRDMVNELFFSYMNNDIKLDYDYIIVICEECYDVLTCAIHLYQRKRCGINLFCNYNKKSKRDCHDFYNYAVNRGVLPADILYDSDAHDIRTDVNHVFKFLLTLNKLCPKVLFVARSHRLYRIKKIVEYLKDKLYYFPTCDYYPSYHRNLNPDEWYLTESGRNVIASEIDIILRNDLYD